MKNRLGRFLQLLFILLGIISCAKKTELPQVMLSAKETPCEVKLLNLIKTSDFHPNETNYFVRAEEIRNDTIILKVFVENNLSDSKKNKEMVESVISWLIIPPKHDGVYQSLNALDPIEPNFKKLKTNENILNEFLSCFLQNKTPNTKNNMKFENLFNEGSRISFTPDNLNSNNPEIIAFKNSLNSFEKTNPTQMDFDLNTLLLLINNETFSNNEYHIDDSWLKYFITKYKFDKTIIDTLMNTAIHQEDFAAVKTLSRNYIFSKKELKEAQEKKVYKDALHGELDINEYYDPTYSKIDEIVSFINHKLSQYTIQDPDGYTNLRKDKNTSSKILQKVKSGDNIEVLDNTGDWFFVKTKEGKEGYIHKSRIK
ncbi:SH3 domain-containing protein [Elizabethkingia anophelis]|uniref:SH3b domain-containing protein n=1 Tax=Elizabethkingia ursingii TaxID=1756150 RepID=A0ABX3N421_9FLAO|nr:SH3 domain-containing protein [Elizabethkingia ursingii]MDV3925525.1 SH3 domain-containing protein [Elizabethkingia anophelis]MDV4023057.1 SH3 domain-containing protein [Elizabethkingia anophelis]OPB84971.1 hypothetical protein BB021_16715 [Elizabethkingia ursingii]